MEDKTKVNIDELIVKKGGVAQIADKIINYYNDHKSLVIGLSFFLIFFLIYRNDMRNTYSIIPVEIENNLDNDTSKIDENINHFNNKTNLTEEAATEASEDFVIPNKKKGHLRHKIQDVNWKQIIKEHIEGTKETSKYITNETTIKIKRDENYYVYNAFTFQGIFLKQKQDGYNHEIVSYNLFPDDLKLKEIIIELKPQ